MIKPFNIWDVLIGAGYGVFGTLLVLKLLDIIPKLPVTGSLIWLATLSFQLYRQHLQKQATCLAEEEAS